MTRSRTQVGAALLTAMLTVTLVATFAATALWQQWRGVEVEAAERSRTQMAWVLTGALDWARLILREDARSGQVDHLSEPWALPLQESRLSSFLTLDKNNTDDAQEAFLSGQITDMQSRMNVLNLVDNGKVSALALRAFGKLFTLLNLPESQLTFLAENLRAASVAGNAQPAAPLLPQRVEQLAWLGLPALTLQILTPYITVLPARTPVNLNTAAAEVIYASVPELDMARARRMVAERASAHFRTLDEAMRATGVPAHLLDTSQFSVASRFFEVRGRLRLEQSIVQERSLVERQGLDVKTLWREREVVAPLMTYAPAFVQ